MVYDPRGHIKSVDVPPEEANAPCLEDSEILRLAKLGKTVDQHYGLPQDIEWAIDTGLALPEGLLILQSRPVTVWGGVKAVNG